MISPPLVSNPGPTMGHRQAMVRSRRSGFSPTDLSGLALWLDAASSHINSGSISDGGQVSSWVDRFASKDFTQGTADKRPLWRESSINSLPAVDFDGTDDLLVLAEGLLTGTSGTVFLVCSLDVANGTDAIFASADEASATRFLYLIPGDGSFDMKVGHNDGGSEEVASGTTTLATGTTYIMMYSSSGTDYSFRLNGTSLSVTGTNDGDWFGDVTGPDNVTVGARKRNTEAIHFNGQVSEVIVYDGTEVTGDDRVSVETFLNKKYAAY